MSAPAPVGSPQAAQAEVMAARELAWERAQEALNPLAAAATAPAPASSSVISITTASAAPAGSARRERRPDSPSSCFGPDPRNHEISFALIDLPIERGETYFPKEIVGIVQDYASEGCFLVELGSRASSQPSRDPSRTSAGIRRPVDAAQHASAVRIHHIVAADSENASVVCKFMSDGRGGERKAW